MSTRQNLSLSNWSRECQNELNNQINIELDASQQYLSLYAYFNRDSVGLGNVANYFKKASEEERDHAMKFIDYQNMRGGKVVLKPIKDYNYEPLGDKKKSDVLKAFELVLQLESIVYQSLLKLHIIGDKCNDPQFCDFIEGEYLKEQVEAIYELNKMISNLKRIGNDGHGIWEFNNKLE